MIAQSGLHLNPAQTVYVIEDENEISIKGRKLEGHPYLQQVFVVIIAGIGGNHGRYLW